MNEKIIWVVGRWRGGGYLNSIWDINGVFDSEQKAVEACQDRPSYFVGPLVLNESLEHDTTEWKGMYYPAAERNTNAHSDSA